MEYTIIMIGIVAVFTFITRAIPFFVLSGKKEVPNTVKYLGNVLPPAIMVILIVYCLKNINIWTGNRGIPEILSILLVAILHIWKKNTLLSVGGGTIFYMVLIQSVF